VKRLMAEGARLGTALGAVGLGKSSWFYRPRPRAPRPLQPELVRMLRTLKGYELCYGYRKVRAWLRRRGMAVNGKCLLRHLQALRMTQPRKRKGRPYASYPQMRPTAPNTYWEADTTGVSTGEGLLWACVVVDPAVGSLPVAGLMHTRCRAIEASAVLEAAVAAAFPRDGRVPEGHQLILRVDRGSQFVAFSFRQTAEALGVTLQYCGVQCPNEKPFVESFFSRYKVEEVYRSEYLTQQEGKVGWEKWTRWYRTRRLHSRLGYRPPMEVQRTFAQATA